MTRIVMVESVGERVLVSELRRASGSASFWEGRLRRFPVANTRGLELGRGDIVEISLPTGRTVLQSMITFLLPLGLFPVTYGIIAVLAPGAGDGILFLVGFGAMLLGFPLVALLCRIAGARIPTVSRLLTDRNSLKSDGCLGCDACVDLSDK